MEKNLFYQLTNPRYDVLWDVYTIFIKNGFMTNNTQIIQLSDGPYSRKHLKMLTNAEARIDVNLPKWVAEGDALLEAEAKIGEKKVVDDHKILETKLGSTSKNPYLRARCEILMKYTEEKRKQIELMEKGEKPKNCRYDEFIKDVTKLGDKMSA